MLCRSHQVTEGTDVSKLFRAGLKLNRDPSYSPANIISPPSSVLFCFSLYLLRTAEVSAKASLHTRADFVQRQSALAKPELNLLP